MIIEFNDGSERLYRAVRYEEKYWKGERIMSSAALRDKEGLSTDRSLGRSPDDCVSFMRANKRGAVVSFSVASCRKEDAMPRHDPVIDKNIYHTLVLGRKSIQLTRTQAIHIIENSKVDHYSPPESFYQLST